MTKCTNSNTKQEWTCIFEVQELAFMSFKGQSASITFQPFRGPVEG